MAERLLDGSAELGALALRLHRWFGIGAIRHEEACAAILTVARPAEGGISLDAFLRLSLASLERCGVLEPAGSGFRLSEKAATFAGAAAAEESRELEAVSRNLDLLLSPGAIPRLPESVGGPPLHEVTRGFLEEVLGDAGLPRELVDGIVETYERRGRLSMSEDGGRYRITLGEE